ncbi:glycoside hydrolase family 127 protein [Candidatus Poribacteria bacterium]|nr:MAG: glycoside hydrolase family 127 protein [Candidatus Poribacteria bacterium]
MRSVLIDTSKSPHAKLRPVPIGAVRLADGFWAPRLRTMREVTLPSQHEILEETGRIDNFRRASGKIKGEFKGLYFNDSDVYKWIEGCAYSLAYERDPKIEELADKVIDEIAEAQDEDGYLNTFFTFEKAGERWTNLRDMHELYCAGHLFHAAVAYRRATGKDKLLGVALRLADHIWERFGPEGEEGVPGHPQIEMALVELYRETGKRRYLELAKLFIDRRGKGLIGGSPYHIDHKPLRELGEVVGHAVRALYLNCGAADLFMETGEEALMAALERMWLNMTGRRMYITGGVGARYQGEAFGGDYELPNERAYAETCAAVANAMWNWRMLLATGEARFADVMELALYNGALSGISLDGKNYFYVNPLADRGGHRRRRWFDCACCPPNIVRLINSVPGMVYSVSEEGIWVHLYVEGEGRIELGDLQVGLRQLTGYPWEGEVRVEVDPPEEAEFSLMLRVPGWCGGASISVNGERVEDGAEPGSYFELRRRWRPGDEVEISFAMDVELLTAHPRVESSWGKAAIRRGPLVYCLEQADNPGFDVWCAYVDLNSRSSAGFRPDLLGGVAVVELSGKAADMALWGDDRLYAPTRTVLDGMKPVKLVFIPYFAWANREPGPMTVWVNALWS